MLHSEPGLQAPPEPGTSRADGPRGAPQPSTRSAFPIAWLRFAQPLEWGLLAAGVVLVLRYAWFMDDAFVYLRYVDNFVQRGLGLVYNPGEYVEGYSSPAWVALLSALRATGATYPAIVNSVGVVSLVATWALLVVLERRMARGARGFPLAMLLLLPNYGVLTHFTSGLEAPLVNVSAVAYALFVTDPRSLPLRIVVGLSPLVRQELFVPAALAVVWCTWRQRRPPWSLLATLSVGLTGLALFRIVYYADLLPNTYYLKDHTDFVRGLLYLHDTLRAYHGYETAAVLVALAVVLARRGVDTAARARVTMLAFALPVALYCIRIGGDFRHFRYLAFPYVLVMSACAGLAASAWREAFGERYRLLRSAGVLVLAFQVASFHPTQLDRHPLHDDVELELRNDIEDAVGHRRYMRRAFPDWMGGKEATPVRSGAPFSKDGILVSARCADCYFAAERRVVHSLGLTDALLARMDVPFDRAAHKYALIPLAWDIARLQRESDSIGRGMYAAAVRRGDAPSWITDNLAQIEIVERKVYNRHHFVENLRLALTRVGPIEPGRSSPASAPLAER